jgi:hypothetical protein
VARLRRLTRSGPGTCIAALVCWLVAAAAEGGTGGLSGLNRGESLTAPTESLPLAGSDDGLNDAIREGYERSATFRALVDHLIDHRTTVHVQWLPTLTSGLNAALLHRVAVAPDGARLLWVVVRYNEPSNAMVALIAHELQHVHEALDSGVVSGAEIAHVFGRIGERSGSHGRTRRLAVYDTRAAQDVQRRVTRELTATSSSGRDR